MSFYFLFLLIISLILVISLFLLLIKRLQMNWTGQNKRGLFYFLPVIIVILFSLVIGLDTYPRLQDTANFIQKNIKTIEVSGKEIITQNNKYIIADKVFLANPYEEEVLKDETYSLSYLPNTRIIIKQVKIEALPTAEQEPIQIEEISPVE